MKKFISKTLFLLLIIISITGCQKDGIQYGTIPDDIYAFLEPFLGMTKGEALKEFETLDMVIKYQDDDYILVQNEKTGVYMNIYFDYFNPTKIEKVNWGMGFLYPSIENAFDSRNEAYEGALKLANSFAKYESNSEFMSAIYHPDPTLYSDIATFTAGLSTYQSTFAGCNANNFRCSFSISYNENNDEIQSNFHVEMFSVDK